MIRFLLVVLIALSGGCYACGNKTTSNELTGQVKKVIKRTPLICPDFVEVDVSLGVMRGGIGSMSHEDVALRVMNEDQVPKLEKAARDGALITLAYDEARIAVCYPQHKLTSFTIDVDPAELDKPARTPDGMLTPDGFKAKIRSLDDPPDAGP